MYYNTKAASLCFKTEVSTFLPSLFSHHKQKLDSCFFIDGITSNVLTWKSSMKHVRDGLHTWQLTRHFADPPLQSLSSSVLPGTWLAWLSVKILSLQAALHASETVPSLVVSVSFWTRTSIQYLVAVTEDGNQEGKASVSTTDSTTTARQRISHAPTSTTHQPWLQAL